MTAGETLLVSLTTAAVVAPLSWVGSYLVARMQRGNDRAKYAREKLMDRYAEFVAAAAADLGRARTEEAAAVLGSADHDLAAELVRERQAHGIDLARLALQIALAERRPALREMVHLIARRQPFMAGVLPPLHGKGNYDERLVKFGDDIAAFERVVLSLTEMVLSRYGPPDERSA